MDLQSRQSTRLTAGQNSFDSQPSYSYDGSMITFVGAHRHRPYSMGGWTWDDYDVYMMQANGKNPTRVTTRKYYGVSSPRFVDGGKKIIYSADVNRAASDLSITLCEV